MENASKALIIAGAILVAILLISVGILIMNSVSAPLDEVQSTATSQATQIFNSKFINYSGPHQVSQKVKSLLLDVIASNASNSNHQIKIRGIGPWCGSLTANGAIKFVTSQEISGLIPKINQNQEYEIGLMYAYASSNGELRFKSVFSPTLDMPVDDVATEPGYICCIEIRELP